MNQKYAALLAVCLLLLAGCAGRSGGAPAAGPEEGGLPAAEYETPDYQFEPEYFAEKHFYASDGSETELARYRYQLDALAVANPEKVQDAGAVERNMEAFNEKMGAMLDGLVERGEALGSDAATLYAQESVDFSHGGFYDEVFSACCITGQVVSVRLESASYTGGAHGSAYTSGCLFDLGTGQFIDATQVAEDPEAFRAGAAELLAEKAEAIEENRDAYWPDYEEILSRWNEGAVLFDGEGMLVVYSPYDLGPYAMGAVELRLSYGELADLVGPGGLARLGAGAAEDAG